MERFNEEWINMLSKDVLTSTMLFKSPHTLFHWKCELTGYEFDAPYIDVLYAKYCANRNLQLKGYLPVNEFFDFISRTDFRDPEYDEYGWTIDSLYDSELVWIDIYQIFDTKNNQFLISYCADPVNLAGEWI